MNIISAIKDGNLLRSFLEDKDGSIKTWLNWMTALRVLYGLPLSVKRAALIKFCTGRDIDKLPKNGFDEALFLTGRRSGKSKIAALAGAFESVLSGREKQLSKGEKGLVIICAPSKKQSRIVKGYLRAIFEIDLFQTEIVSEEKDGFTLSNGVEIWIMAGDWRTIRGFTLLAAIVDEVCFFGYDAESKIRSDTELIRAIKPSLATTGGKLVCISSPYAKRGWSYKKYKKNFGNDKAKTLVWNCSSRTMNETLPQSVVDDALSEDLQSAKSEYLGEFRDDIAAYLPRETIESVVIVGRKELLHVSDYNYFAFVDVSGGRSESSAVAIGHRDKKKKVIVDFIKEYKAPHNPHAVIGSICEILRRFNIKRITGDNYGAEFVAAAFKASGFIYDKSQLSKSQLYLELIPQICSNQIELLDDEILINQLSNLERRTRSGGKDTVDHPQGGKDDVANVIAGVSFITSKNRKILGAFGR